MTEKTQEVRKLLLEGYNCAQAVLGAFSEELGLDFDSAVKMAASFGGGMGGLKEVCGALSGVFMIAGLKYGYTDPADADAKAAHYALIQRIAERFKEKEESILCRDLLDKLSKTDLEGLPEEYKKRPCLSIVETAAELAEEVLAGKI